MTRSPLFATISPIAALVAALALGSAYAQAPPAGGQPLPGAPPPGGQYGGQPPPAPAPPQLREPRPIVFVATVQLLRPPDRADIVLARRPVNSKGLSEP